MKIKKFLNTFKFLLILLLLSQSVLATSLRWTGQYGSNWQDPLNWDIDLISTDDIAYFDNKPLYQPDNFGIVTIGGLNFNDAKSEFLVTNDGEMTFTETGIDNTSSFSQTIINNKQLNFQGDSMAVNVSIVNNGLMDISQLRNAGMIVGSVSGSGDIELGDKVLAVGGLNTDDLISGEIRGSGEFGLVKFGTGRLTLTGDNTYTGVTIVKEGTLQLGNNTYTGSVTGDIVNNGTVIFHNYYGDLPPPNNYKRFYSGVISGSGKLIQLGPVDLVLTGNNTYTGETVIADGGRLVLGYNQNTGQISGPGGDVINNGRFIFSPGYHGTSFFERRITGNGEVEIEGQGVTIFAVDNNYMGGTEILYSTLQLGYGEGGSESGMIGDAGVWISKHSTLVINRSNEVIIDSEISGEGLLKQIGTGTTILTNDNQAFSGNVEITDGALQLGESEGGGTTGMISDTGTVNIGSGASLVFNRADDIIFGGFITGAGSVTQMGSGMTTFTVNNDYTGGTNITSGTLQLGNGDTSGMISDSGTVNIAGGASLVFNRADDLAFGGLITGAGSVVKRGDGTTIFTANNDYTGGTYIESGILQLGNGRNGMISDKGVVTIGGGASLAFYRLKKMTFGGLMTGEGSVTQIGDGETIFTADNTYAGLTYIWEGALQLGSGEGGGFSGSIVGDVFIQRAASLVFNRADEVIFGGRISGDGSVVKNGKGTVIFNGYYDYTGGTFVNEGGLLLGGDEADSDAYMKGDVYLAEGATFGGHGTLEGKLINNGVFAPSASIGVTNVTDYEQTAEGTLTVEVDANGRSDLVNATGTASLAGNLVLDTSAGFIPGFEYRFMNADQGITGQFDNVSDSGLLLQNFLTAQVNIDNNTASLVADFNSSAMLAAANTPNRLAVTNFILQGGASPEVQGLVGSATSDSDFNRLTDQLSASTYANQTLQLSQTAKWFDRQLVDRMTDASGSALWIAPYASSATISGALDTRMGGVSLGSDFGVGENGKWGFAFSSTYFSSDASGNESASDDGTLYQFGIYGSSQEANWLFGAGLEVGITDAINTTRNVGKNTVSSDYRATVFSGQAKASYDITLKDTHVRPFIGLIKQQVSRGSFSESGNTGLAWQVNDSDYNSTQSQLGISTELPFKSLLLTASAAWQHEFEDTQSDVDFKNGLHIEGVSIGRDSALLQAGVVLLQSDCMTISATYEGVFANEYAENGAKLQVVLTIG